MSRHYPSEQSLCGRNLHLHSLCDALYAWSFLGIGVMTVVAFLLGSNAQQAIVAINANPALMALLIYEILSSVSVFSLAFDLYAFITLALTLVASYNLLRGSSAINGKRRAIAILGSAVALLGSGMALIGYAQLFLFRYQPVVKPYVSATKLGPLVMIPLPLPWMISLGLILWCLGMFVYSIGLVLAFGSVSKVRAKRLSALLAAGFALMIFPLLGMIIAIIACRGLRGA
ncbi:MAG: hypothetical protein ACP5GO_04945 [Thermoprotei archaeon]